MYLTNDVLQKKASAQNEYLILFYICTYTYTRRTSNCFKAGDEWTICQTDLSAFAFIVLPQPAPPSSFLFLSERKYFSLYLPLPKYRFAHAKGACRRLVCMPISIQFHQEQPCCIFIYRKRAHLETNSGEPKNDTCGKNYNLYRRKKNFRPLTCCCSRTSV